LKEWSDANEVPGTISYEQPCKTLDKVLKRSRESRSIQANTGDMIEVINNGEFYGQRFQVVTSDDTHITTRELIGYTHIHTKL
jgi:hypothetical protein